MSLFRGNVAVPAFL